MAYTRTYATKWPLLDFFFRVWKLQAAIVLMSPSAESMSYNYLALIIHWGDKQLFIFRLYDTERRVLNHFDSMNTSPSTSKIEKKCICKHKLKDHGLYEDNGESAKGSRYVCQKDGCSMWSYCDL